MKALFHLLGQIYRCLRGQHDYLLTQRVRLCRCCGHTPEPP